MRKKAPASRNLHLATTSTSCRLPPARRENNSLSRNSTLSRDRYFATAGRNSSMNSKKNTVSNSLKSLSWSIPRMLPAGLGFRPPVGLLRREEITPDDSVVGSVAIVEQVARVDHRDQGVRRPGTQGLRQHGRQPQAPGGASGQLEP